MYLVVEGNHAIVIDPFVNTDPSMGLVIDYILLTHEHYDHISGVNNWKKIKSAPVLCSSTCARNIQDSRKNLAYFFKDFCDLQSWIKLDSVPDFDPNYVCHADEVFNIDYIIDWRGHRIHLFELPGHSLGSIGIVIDDLFFFSGDSLFKDFEVSLNAPGSSKKKWKEISQPRLGQLPLDIRVYPGHFGEFILKNRAII